MYLTHSLFNLDPHGHGGEKRSAQIAQILSENGINPINFDTNKKMTHWNRFQMLLAALPLARDLYIPLWNLRGLVRFGDCVLQFKDVFTRCSRNRVLLWESNRSNMFPLPVLAKRAGLRIMALPHNLESLVPEQYSWLSGKVSPHWLKEELKALAMCDCVITISREEQWLLRLHGIDADYLPYYPPDKAEVLLKEISCKRREGGHRSAKKYLILGTFGNPPTRLGMVEIIRYINMNNLGEKGNIELHIAGYGSEHLNDYIQIPKGIVLHGGLPIETFSKLLIDMDAIIVHQHPSTGCLTKIPEMLIAGLPVILNTNAARSWERWPGVHVYETWAELISLMRSDLPLPMPPQRPIEHERRFIKKLNELSGVME